MARGLNGAEMGVNGGLWTPDGVDSGEQGLFCLSSPDYTLTQAAQGVLRCSQARLAPYCGGPANKQAPATLAQGLIRSRNTWSQGHRHFQTMQVLNPLEPGDKHVHSHDGCLGDLPASPILDTGSGSGGLGGPCCQEGCLDPGTECHWGQVDGVQEIHQLP